LRPGISTLGSLRAAILVAGLALTAYLPSLAGEFVYDDVRFVEVNQAVHGLSPAGVVSYFTDPTNG